MLRIGFGQVAIWVVGLALFGSQFSAQESSAQESSARQSSPQKNSGQSSSGKLSIQNAEVFAKLLDQDWKDKPEWAIMLTDILSGKPMKANSGWFKPSQSRLGWKWFAQKFDRNQDAKVSRSEAKDFAKVFDAIDQNGDGGITAVDFNWDDVSHVGPSKPSEALFFMLDRDSNGRVDQREIMQMMAGLDEERNGYLTPDEFAKGFSMFDKLPAKKPKAPARKEDPNRMLNMLFSGELGTLTDGPKLGQLAPDFELPLLKGTSKVKLSKFRGDKIVVLNFGSFT